MGLRGPKLTHKKIIDAHIRGRGDQVYIPWARYTFSVGFKGSVLAPSYFGWIFF